MSPVRRGTPESALASIRPQDGGVDSEAHTVDIAETVIGSATTEGEAPDVTDGSSGSTPTVH